MIGFKVLVNGQSPWAPVIRNYKIGVPTTPRRGDGPLNVFNTLNMALVYLKVLGPGRELYLVEYSQSTHRKLWYMTAEGKARTVPSWDSLEEDFADSITLIQRMR